MAQTITANELKTKGVTILNDETTDGTEVIITVRGKNKFVVLPIAKYNFIKHKLLFFLKNIDGLTFINGLILSPKQ